MYHTILIDKNINNFIKKLKGFNFNIYKFNDKASQMGFLNENQFINDHCNPKYSRNKNSINWNELISFSEKPKNYLRYILPIYLPKTELKLSLDKRDYPCFIQLYTKKVKTLEFDILVQYCVYQMLNPKQKCLLYNLIKSLYHNIKQENSQILFKKTRICDKWICQTEKSNGCIKHFIDTTEFDEKEFEIVGVPNFKKSFKYNCENNKLYVGSIIYPDFITDNDCKEIINEWNNIKKREPEYLNGKTNLEINDKIGRIKWWNLYMYHYGNDLKNGEYDINFVPHSQPMKSLTKMKQKLIQNGILDGDVDTYKMVQIKIDNRFESLPIVQHFEAAVEYQNEKAHLASHLDYPYNKYKVIGINLLNEVKIRYSPINRYIPGCGGRNLVDHLFSYNIPENSIHIMLPYTLCNIFKHGIMSYDIKAPRVVFLIRTISMSICTEIIVKYILTKNQNKNIKQILREYIAMIQKNFKSFT